MPTAAAVAASVKPAPAVGSDEMSSMVANLLGGAAGGAGARSPDSTIGSAMPKIHIKDQQVSMEGDIVHGRFLTEIAGKDVWITISGHLRRKRWLRHL